MRRSTILTNLTLRAQSSKSHPAWRYHTTIILRHACAREELRHGVIPKRMKILPKVSSFSLSLVLCIVALILLFCYFDDATTLDVWVLDQLATLLKNATENTQLSEHLHKPGVVCFLHLLGLGTRAFIPTSVPVAPSTHGFIRIYE